MNETLFRNCHVVVNPKHNNQLLRGIRSRPSDRRCNTLDQTLPLVRSASLPEQIRTGHTSTKVCHRMFAGELCLRFQQLKNLGLTHQPDQQLLTRKAGLQPAPFPRKDFKVQRFYISIKINKVLPRFLLQSAASLDLSLPVLVRVFFAINRSRIDALPDPLLISPLNLRLLGFVLLARSDDHTSARHQINICWAVASTRPVSSRSVNPERWDAKQFTLGRVRLPAEKEQRLLFCSSSLKLHWVN